MEWDTAEDWHREGDGNGFEVRNGDEDGDERGWSWCWKLDGIGWNRTDTTGGWKEMEMGLEMGMEVGKR